VSERCQDAEMVAKYTVRSTSVPTRPGCWNMQRVEVLCHGEKVGEYEYNYHSDTPFYPFRDRQGREFALYSRDYTATRVMSLPDCKDLGGEDRESFGFCPVAYFVPTVTVQMFADGESRKQPYNPRHDPKRWATIRQENGHTVYDWPTGGEFEEACKKASADFTAWLEAHPFKEVPADFGFVAGCVWGDDCSWKVQYLDLSRVSEGIITRDDRFGYIELLGSADTLADSISTDGWDEDSPSVQIACSRRFRTDKREAE